MYQLISFNKCMYRYNPDPYQNIEHNRRSRKFLHVPSQPLSVIMLSEANIALIFFYHKLVLPVLQLHMGEIIHLYPLWEASFTPSKDTLLCTRKLSNCRASQKPCFYLRRGKNFLLNRISFKTTVGNTIKRV